MCHEWLISAVFCGIGVPYGAAARTTLSVHRMRALPMCMTAWFPILISRDGIASGV